MAPATLFRLATRAAPVGFFRASYTARPRLPAFVNAAPAAVFLGGASSFSTTPRFASGHEEETFEEFTAR